MATYTLVAGDKGAYEKALTASTVDTVTFPFYAPTIEVWTSGADFIYVTVDGSTPADQGTASFFLPATQSVRILHPERQPTATPTVVKLISTGTPSYSVSVVE